MALTAGTRLGSYEIVGPLGAGGMGVVYRAHDVKLGRDVAIKLLPEDFAHDAEYVARFLREAKVLAALNHVNVGAIYDLLNVANTHFLILELVEGETLAERIARGPLPVDEAIGIAIQIVEALEAAHQTGIVHRDLKPANIKITPQGRIKVLDFGLAKMSETRSLADPSAVTLTLAPAGSIVGTVSYMSPEQARGQDVTKQTDIWAFGCVFFEMLTGSQAFSGKTAADILAKILKEEPAWDALNTGIRAASIRRVIERCLLKDPRRRFHDAGDIRYELEEPSIEAATPAPSRSNRPAIVLVGLLLISILAAGAIWQFKPENPAPSWSGTRLGGPAIAMRPRVSPDGKMLAFHAFVDGNTQLAVMNPLSGNWKVLTDDNTKGSVEGIEWSKDGTKIYFCRVDDLPKGIYSIPALGGEPRLVLENASGGEPLQDGSLLIVRVNASREPQLHRFWPDSGRLQALDAIANPNFGLAFQAFPGREEVVFLGSPAEGQSANADRGMYILDLKNNKSRSVALEGIDISTIGLAGVNPSDGSIVIVMRTSDLNEIISIPSDGRGQRRVLMTLTQGVCGMDMASDGSLYLGQCERTLQALRFNESAQIPKVMAEVSGSEVSLAEHVLGLPGDRFLLNSVFDGRKRLLVSNPAGELVPLVDADEHTQGPATMVGPDRVAFVLGSAPEQSIGIASVKDGRLLQRFKITTNNVLRSLSASADGGMLFYSNDRSIWSIPSAGGEPRRLGDGDAVAFDPRHQSLVVQLDENDRIRLVRMPLSGGPTEPISMQGDLRLPLFSILGTNSVRADGKIGVVVAYRDSWFLSAAVLDPESGIVRRLPMRYEGDVLSVSWNSQNEIVAAGLLFRGNIWRFRPVPSK